MTAMLHVTQTRYDTTDLVELIVEYHPSRCIGVAKEEKVAVGDAPLGETRKFSYSYGNAFKISRRCCTFVFQLPKR